MGLLLLSIQSYGQTDFTPHGTQPGLNFQLEGGSKCHSCHAGYPNTPSYEDDKKYMPYLTWAGSMKANASRDPLFWAAVDVANNDIPGVGDFCIRCHTPQGWLAGRAAKPVSGQTPATNGAAGCGLSGDHVSRDGALNDYTGVSCHYCHRVDELGPMGEAHNIGNGNAWIDDEVCDSPFAFGPCRKGPYNYTDSGSHSPPPHEWKQDPFLSKSEFCGSCHDVSSPEIEQNGMLVIAKKLFHSGVETEHAMPIERTYSEWQQSLFADLIYRDGLDMPNSDTIPYLAKGETCQGCHMPQSDDPNTKACQFNTPGDRQGDLATHQFVGGNAWMPMVIKNTYGDALEADNEGVKELYDETRDWALAMLQTQSAHLEVEQTSNDGNQATVAVKVTNLTGHKLPTGYPEGRRMWLHLRVEDANQQLVFESGAYDPATAILTEDPQIKIYEALQGIWNTNSQTCDITDAQNRKMFHFVLNNCIYKDNRIPPLGFKGGDDITLAPVGQNYPIIDGEMVNHDTTEYTFPVIGVVMPLSVTATLNYQTASKEYIEFLDNQATENSFQSENLTCDRQWTVGPADMSRGAFMKSLWENNGRSAPVPMATESIQGPIMVPASELEDQS